MKREVLAAVWPLLLLAVLVVLVVWRQQPPASPGVGAGVADVQRLERHLVTLASGPRATGSPQAFAARDYLVGELESLGLATRVQSGTVESRRWGPIHLHNVIARLPGTGGLDGVVGAVLMVVHYDARAGGSHGAGDAGAAVAALLETARIMAADPPARDLIFLFTDAEELGLLGARLFVREAPEIEDVVAVLNFEGRGVRGPAILFETGPGDARLVGLFARNASHATGSSAAVGVYRLLPNDTDFTVFRQLGLPGLNFAFIDGLAHYHTVRDTPEYLDRRSMYHHARLQVETARAVGNAPRIEARHDAIFFDVLGWLVVRYPAWLAWPTVLAGMALAGVVTWQATRRERWKVLAGLGAHTLHLVAVLIWVVLLTRFEAGVDAHERTEWAVAGAGLLALGGAVWLGRSLVGAAIWAAVLGVAVTAIVPGASYLLVWPAVLLCGAVLLPERWRHAGLGAAAAVATLVLLPVAHHATVALTVGMLAGPAVLLVILAWMWRPVLEPAWEGSKTRRWVASLAPIAAGLGCFVYVYS